MYESWALMRLITFFELIMKLSIEYVLENPPYMIDHDSSLEKPFHLR